MNKKNFGPIYAKASNGKIKFWSAEVEDNILKITHGYHDGKKVTDSKQVFGKNIGKVNETSPFDQACSEAQSKMNKKFDEGYIENIENVLESVVELPMLAHPYKDRSHYLKYPCYIQPKLNGVRCISKINNGNVNYISRKGKNFENLSHLNPLVEKFINEVGCKPDGEIFNPNWNFQEIIRSLKKERETSKELEYWIYDIVDTEIPFSQRTSKISNFFNKFKDGENNLGFSKFGSLVCVPTFSISNETEFKEYHNEFVQKYNFEGSILRNSDGLYVLKHRSNDLLKYKDFIDDEFIIVGAHEGTGNDSGTIIFECVNKFGSIFSVKPKGSREQRKEWLQNIDNLIGKELTVRYQELSEDKIPIFPVGIALRDYEDDNL